MSTQGKSQFVEKERKKVKLKHKILKWVSWKGQHQATNQPANQPTDIKEKKQTKVKVNYILCCRCGCFHFLICVSECLLKPSDVDDGKSVESEIELEIIK